VELLQRSTAMRVVQAADRCRSNPTASTVVPAGADCRIVRGVLRLLAPSTPLEKRAPLDAFFRALAATSASRRSGSISPERAPTAPPAGANQGAGRQTVVHLPLAARRHSAGSPLDGPDALRLVHELQVHQIELERRTTS